MKQNNQYYKLLEVKPGASKATIQAQAVRKLELLASNAEQLTEKQLKQQIQAINIAHAALLEEAEANEQSGVLALKKAGLFAIDLSLKIVIRGSDRIGINQIVKCSAGQEFDPYQRLQIASLLLDKYVLNLSFKAKGTLFKIENSLMPVFFNPQLPMDHLTHSPFWARNPNIVVVTYQVEQKDSFVSAQQLLEFLDKNNKTMKLVLIGITGQEGAAVIPRSSAISLAQKYLIDYYEWSPITQKSTKILSRNQIPNLSITDMWEQIVISWAEDYGPKLADDKSQIQAQSYHLP